MASFAEHSGRTPQCTPKAHSRAAVVATVTEMAPHSSFVSSVSGVGGQVQAESIRNTKYK